MNGSGYYTLKSAAAELGLTTDHMTGKKWWTDKNRPIPQPKPLCEILVANSGYTSTSSLKKRLWSERLLPKHCQICGIDDWMGREAPLALDHINGNRKDNRLENLRILCYNCHGQTETFGRKNRGRVTGTWYTSSAQNGRHGSSNLPTPTLCVICLQPCKEDVYWHRKCLVCVDCGKPCTSLRCKPCAAKVRQKPKIDWPDLSDLLQMVHETSYVAVGKSLGVSDNAVRKRIRSLS